MKKIFTFFIHVLIIAIMVSPSLVIGQGGGNTSGTGGGGNPAPLKFDIKIENPFNCGGKADCTITDLLKTIINDILLPIGAVVAVLMVMFAGFKFVTARGNAADIQKARDSLWYAVIGAAILLGAWVISEAIQGTINQLRS